MRCLLVTVDSLRKDHFKYMPNTQGFLDSTHEHAFATFTATLGSFQSILGGKYPTDGYLTDTRSVASLFEEDRVAITANRLTSERYGYADDFDIFQSPINTGEESKKDRLASLLPHDTLVYQVGVWTWNRYQSLVSRLTEVEKSFRPANEIIDEFLKVISDRHEWFGWLHFMEPHHPYDPEDGPVNRVSAQQMSRRAIAGSGTEADSELVTELYRQEVKELDKKLSALWNTLPDEVRVVFCADHGELLGENRQWGHPSELRPEILNVPFGTKNYPELGEVVSLIDVPTILSGVEHGRGMFNREIAFASVADRKAAMNQDHIATADRVTTHDGEPADDLRLERALDRFDPEHVFKNDAVREDLEDLGYL